MAGTLFDNFVRHIPPSAASFDTYLEQSVRRAKVKTTTSNDPSLPEDAKRDLVAFIERYYNGGTVLIKTSTSGDRNLHHEIHPSILQETLDCVLDRIPARKLLLGDGPAFTANYANEVERLGFLQISKSREISIIDLNLDESIEIFHLPISKTFLKADLVINLTRGKTHRRFGVSLSRKSLVGTIVGEKTGYPKLSGKHHLVLPLVDELMKQQLHIWSFIDAFAAIQGEGPLNGFRSKSKFFVYGEDTLGVDALCCVQFGFDPAITLGLLSRMPDHLMGEGKKTDWFQYRVSNLDLQPAVQHAWLWQSLYRQSSRENIYSEIRREVSQCLAKMK